MFGPVMRCAWIRDKKQTVGNSGVCDAMTMRDWVRARRDRNIQ